MAYFKFEAEQPLESAWAPVIDVCELAAEFVIRVELPGVDKQDIRLRWKNNILSVTGTKHRQPSKVNRCRFLCIERQYGHFRRDINVPVPIDFKNARAEFKHGLLRVRLPKAVEPRGGSFIPIE